MTRILYDGWPLIHQPGSFAALHLLSILGQLPEAIEAWVALPGPPPAWMPSIAHPVISAAADTPASRLGWEQRRLPELCRRSAAQLLHLTTSAPPLFSPVPTLLSPAENQPLAFDPGFTGRLRHAFGAGGRARLGGLLWPSDLPLERSFALELAQAGHVFRLPPLVEPLLAPVLFPDLGDIQQQIQALDLPETYILHHGAAHIRAQELLDAWSWAARSIGYDYPLVVAGLGSASRAQLEALARQQGLAETLRILPELHPAGLTALVQGCTIFFHPAHPAAWGGLLRLALASGKPVVGLDDPQTAALVGTAGYLVRPGDGRGLGAALITLVVEPQMAENMAQAAQKLASGWQGGNFARELAVVYQAVAGSA